MMFTATIVFAAVAVLAQAASTNDFPTWATWGVLGLVVAGFVTKQLVPGWMYQDLQRENEALRAENIRLVQLTLDTQRATLPAIEASTTAVSEAMAEMRAMRQRGSP